NVITYMGLEPVAAHVDATELVFLGTSGNDQILLRAAPDADQLTITSQNGTFESHTFTMPSNSVTIEALAGIDTVTIEPLGSYTNALSVVGGNDDDTLILRSDVAVTLTDTTFSFGETFEHSEFEKYQVFSPALDTTNFTSGYSYIQGIPLFQAQGPAPSTGGGVNIPTQNSPVTGAVSAVVAHPTDANIIYIGTVNGGIWRAENAIDGMDGVDNDGDGDIDADDPDEALHWTSLTDQFPSLSISTLAFDPADATHQTLYAGTGKVSSSYLGGEENGLLKTTNGGDTWTLISPPELRGHTINKILPTTLDGELGKTIVFVATAADEDAAGRPDYEGGLFISRDSGATFSKISGNDTDNADNNGESTVDEAGEGNGLPGGTYSGVWSDPTDNNLLYAAIPSHGVYKSVDGGTSWSTVNIGLPSAVVVSDTAQGGAANSITLAAADAAANDDYNNQRVRIIDGTGLGQVGIISDYDAATKVATIANTWATAPDATSVYEIVADEARRVELTISAADADPGADTHHPVFVAFIHEVGATLAQGAAAGSNQLVVHDGPGTQFQADDTIRIIDPTTGNNEKATVVAVAAGPFANTISLTLSKNLTNAYPDAGRGTYIDLPTSNDWRVSSVWRSTDEGATWTALPLPTSVDTYWFDADGDGSLEVGAGATNGLEVYAQTFGVNPGGQASSHFSFVADPNDPNVVYIGGDTQPVVDSWDWDSDGNLTTGPGGPADPVTGNGEPAGTTEINSSAGFTADDAWFGRIFRADVTAGTVWQQVVGTNANGTATHADSRGMVFDQAGNIIQIDDGGIYRMVDPGTPAQTWQSINADLNLTEFYSIGFSLTSNLLVGGAQDNGSTLQSASGSLEWIEVGGGDGSIVQVAGDTFYFSAQNLGEFTRRTGGVDTLIGLTVDGTDSNPGAGTSTVDLDTFDRKIPFTTRYAVNTVDPSRMMIGTQYLYESANRGDNLTLLTGVPGNALPANTVTPPSGNLGGDVTAIVYGGRQPDGV
ncbi:MAG: hypothetical protein JJ992_29925, partial [Planctomycetes bacterium]|nr:hypothetical protein [Planctomycetota bacterium]